MKGSFYSVSSLFFHFPVSGVLVLFVVVVFQGIEGCRARSHGKLLLKVYRELLFDKSLDVGDPSSRSGGFSDDVTGDDLVVKWYDPKSPWTRESHC